MPISYLDALATHALDAHRYTKAERERIGGVFSAFFAEAMRELRGVDPEDLSELSFRQGRLGGVLSQISGRLGAQLSEFYGVTIAPALERFARLENAWNVGLFSGVSSGVYAAVPLNPQTLADLANNAIVEGSYARDWWAKQAVDVQSAFEQRVRLGLLRGESLQEVAQRIRGKFTGRWIKARTADGSVTKIREFVGGLEGVAASNAKRLVHTSAMKVMNDTNRAWMLANSDVIGGLQQVSTLDTRTTPICRRYDGKIFSLPDFAPVGHDLPYAGGTPRHFNCRSREVPILHEEVEGKEPIDGSGSIRASMGGPVPADWDYGKWLASQPAQAMKQVFGETVAQAVVSGAATLAQAIETIPSKILTEEAIETAAVKVSTTAPAPPEVLPAQPLKVSEYREFAARLDRLSEWTSGGRTARNLYTGSLYRDMNAYLRYGEEGIVQRYGATFVGLKETLAEVRGLVADMLEGFKGTMGRDVLMYRGTNLGRYVKGVNKALVRGSKADKLRLIEQLRGELIGQMIEDGGFMSASTNLRTAEAFMGGASSGSAGNRIPALFRINVPAEAIGVKGLEAEFEVIFKPGTKLYITGVELEGGQIIVYAELIQT